MLLNLGSREADIESYTKCTRTGNPWTNGIPRDINITAADAVEAGLAKVSFYSDSYTESTESGYGQVDVFGTRLEETIDGNNFYKLNNGYQYNYYANSGSVDLSATPS